MQVSAKAVLLAALMSPALLVPVFAQDTSSSASSALSVSSSAEPASSASTSPTAAEPAAAAEVTEQTVSGTVTDLFGDRFVLDTGSKHLLVGSRLPLASGQMLQTGDKLTVTGSAGPAGFDASSITSNGTELLADEATLPAGPGGGRPPVPPAPGAALPGSDDAGGPGAPGMMPPAGPDADNQMQPAAPGAVQPHPSAPHDHPGKGPDGARTKSAPPAMSDTDATKTLTDLGFTDIAASQGGPAHHAYSGKLGDTAVTVGLRPDGAIDRLVVDGNGTVKVSDLGKVLPSGLLTALQSRGITDLSSFEASPRAYVVNGTGANGQQIAIAVGANDRVKDVSVTQPTSAPVASTLSETDAATLALKQGYRLDGTLSATSGGFAGPATNPFGEHVTVTLDADGVVSQERLIRS